MEQRAVKNLFIHSEFHRAKVFISKKIVFYLHLKNKNANICIELQIVKQNNTKVSCSKCNIF